MTKKGITLCSIALLSIFVVSCAFYFSFFDLWQEKVIDRFFVKETPPSNIVIVAIDDRSISEMGQWPWPRALFVGAIQKLQNAKIIGFDINFSEPSRLGLFDDGSLVQALDLSSVPVVMPIEVGNSGNITVQPTHFIRPHVEIGIVNIVPEKDGVLRFVHRGATSTALFSSVLSGKGLSQDLRVNYKGPAKTFLTIPFVDVVQGNIPSRITKDAIVLIGATAPNLHDFVETPYGQMSGVEFHANAVSTFLDNVHFSDLSRLISYIVFVILAVLATLLVIFFKKVLTLSFSFVGGIVSILVLALVAFSYKLILPVLYMELIFVLAGALTLVFQYAIESKEKRFIRQVFQYYLTPHVIEELIKDPSKVSLGGEEREMTVLFSDIRSFTTISEKMTPQELTALLNEYLTAMTDIIMEEGGVVDKYIGDAVMAFWGAPLSNPNQADRAVTASTRMKFKLFELNQDWVKRGWPELHIGVGINKGKMVVGNMGSSKRFNYTVMGDEVNFASRLEGITKHYGVPCLVSENVAKSAVATEDLVFRDIDLVLVKGKKEPKRIFEPMGKTPFIERWNKGRTLYALGKWKEATEEFEAVLKISPHDAPAILYIERCQKLSENPPVEWKGVYEFKDK